MMKPLIIVPQPFNDIAACGGFLARFYDQLIDEYGDDIDIRNRARILYASIASFKGTKFVDQADQVEAIKANSEILGYTWECMYWGRKYRNKFSELSVAEFHNKLRSRIDFYKPTHVFLEDLGRSTFLPENDVDILYVHTLDVIRDFFPNVSLFTFTRNSAMGMLQPFNEYQRMNKVAAWDHYDEVFGIDSIKDWDARRGTFIGKKYAEAFTPLIYKSNLI